MKLISVGEREKERVEGEKKRKGGKERGREREGGRAKGGERRGSNRERECVCECVCGVMTYAHACVCFGSVYHGVYVFYYYDLTVRQQRSCTKKNTQVIVAVSNIM